MHKPRQQAEIIQNKMGNELRPHPLMLLINGWGLLDLYHGGSHFDLSQTQIIFIIRFYPTPMLIVSTTSQYFPEHSAEKI